MLIMFYLTRGLRYSVALPDGERFASPQLYADAGNYAAGNYPPRYPVPAIPDKVMFHGIGVNGRFVPGIVVVAQYGSAVRTWIDRNKNPYLWSYVAVNLTYR